MLELILRNARIVDGTGAPATERDQASLLQHRTAPSAGLLASCRKPSIGQWTKSGYNVTHRWSLLLAEKGLKDACRERPELLSGINCTGGKLTCNPVGDAHSLAVSNAAEVLEL